MTYGMPVGLLVLLSPGEGEVVEAGDAGQEHNASHHAVGARVAFRVGGHGMLRHFDGFVSCLRRGRASPFHVRDGAQQRPSRLGEDTARAAEVSGEKTVGRAGRPGT